MWSLRALRTFEVCARRLSFSASADELRITQGAVSKQIKSLEQNLDFALFIRRGNKISLTPEGKELALHLSGMFDELDDFIGNLGPHSLKSSLVISCEPTICLKLLIPLAPQIEAETGVSLKVLSGGGEVDFHRYGIDIAIRRNDFPIDRGLSVETIGSEYMGPVLHSDLDFATGSSPASFTRIHALTRKGAWTHWYGNQSIAEKVPGILKYDTEHQHHFMALEAAENGHGIAMMSLYMVARNLQQARLKAPLGFVRDGSEYICLSRAPFSDDPRKLALISWFRSLFSSYENEFGDNL